MHNGDRDGFPERSGLVNCGHWMMPMLWSGGRADKISNKLAGDAACLGGSMVEHKRWLGSRRRSGNKPGPSQTLLLLVHLSRFESLRPRKSRQAVRSKKNNGFEVNLWLRPVLFAGSTSGASEDEGFCVPSAPFPISRGQDVGQLIMKPMTNWNWFMSQVVLKEGMRWLDMAEQTGLTWNFWPR